MTQYITNIAIGEVLPYQYEPEVGEKTSNVTDQSDSEQERDSEQLFKL